MEMGSIISTITGILGDIPIIGDIIKMIMGLFGGDDEQPADGGDTTDGQ